MRIRRPVWPASQELAAYLEGELAPEDAQRVERELAGSPDARRRLLQLSTIRARLAAPDPELERLDLVPALQRALMAGPSPASARTTHWIWSASALTVASVALVVSLHGQRAEVEFRSKSAARSAPVQTRAGLQVYRELDGRPPESVVGEFSRGQGLLFSFTNVGSAPFTHLMVFAVDAGSAVRWFYPAYVKEGTNPTSIPIVPSRTGTLLSNVIRHPYALGPLTIYALFTREPLRVSAVEAWLDAARLNPRDPPVRDSKLQTFELMVQP